MFTIISLTGSFLYIWSYPHSLCYPLHNSRMTVIPDSYACVEIMWFVPYCFIQTQKEPAVSPYVMPLFVIRDKKMRWKPQHVGDICSDVPNMLTIPRHIDNWFLSYDKTVKRRKWGKYLQLSLNLYKQDGTWFIISIIAYKAGMRVGTVLTSQQPVVWSL